MRVESQMRQLNPKDLIRNPFIINWPYRVRISVQLTAEPTSSIEEQVDTSNNVEERRPASPKVTANRQLRRLRAAQLETVTNGWRARRPHAGLAG